MTAKKAAAKKTAAKRTARTTAQASHPADEVAISGHSVGGLATDEGGRPIVDAGGRPVREEDR